MPEREIDLIKLYRVDRPDQAGCNVDETTSLEASIKESFIRSLGVVAGKLTATTDTKTRPSEKGSRRRGTEAHEIVELSRNSAGSNELIKEDADEFA
jgi:hypothetical protein